MSATATLRRPALDGRLTVMARCRSGSVTSGWSGLHPAQDQVRRGRGPARSRDVPCAAGAPGLRRPGPADDGAPGLVLLDDHLAALDHLQHRQEGDGHDDPVARSASRSWSTTSGASRSARRMTSARSSRVTRRGAMTSGGAAAAARPAAPAQGVAQAARDRAAGPPGRGTGLRRGASGAGSRWKSLASRASRRAARRGRVPEEAVQDEPQAQPPPGRSLVAPHRREPGARGRRARLLMRMSCEATVMKALMCGIWSAVEPGERVQEGAPRGRPGAPRGCPAGAAR